MRKHILQNISANKRSKIIMLAVMAIVLGKIAIMLQLRLGGDDDQYFLAALSHSNIIDFIIQRYNTWSGRVSLEALMVLTIGYPIVWKIGIPASLLLLSCSISRIANGKVTIVGSFIAMLLLLLVPSTINKWAAWWVTGFFNYLLPASMAFYGFSVMLRESPPKYEVVFALFSSLLFSYHEQIAIVFLICGISMLIVCAERRNIFTIAMLAFCAANFLVMIKAPGNYSRMEASIWNWMPEFSEYNILNKIALGYDKVHQAFVIRKNIPLVALVSILAFQAWRLGKRTMPIVLSIVISTIFIVISITTSLTKLPNEMFFNDTLYLTASKWSSGSYYLSYFFIMATISSMLMMIYSLREYVKQWIMIMILFLTGILTVFMMGFSPTVYASGFRVNYIFELACITSFMCIVSSFHSKKNLILNCYRTGFSIRWR